jgi:serine/threonine protein kinase
MTKLLPQATLPKYLTTKLTASWYQASDLIVLDCSDKPIGTPYHPCRVQHRKTKETYFLKTVDNDQPQPTKRELSSLHKIEEAGLHKKFHVPLLEGLVTFNNAEATPTGRKRIMGFLLTDIPSPTPLTFKLDPTIAQTQRDGWSKEADRIKSLLHENDIVWGDAKADNFVVDGEGQLWIIDFGGSYTEGWVEEGLNETVEGDDMGTEKIVNALKDPVNNVQRPEDEGQEEVGVAEGLDDERTDRARVNKRGRDGDDNPMEKGAAQSVKRSKLEETTM